VDSLGVVAFLVVAFQAEEPQNREVHNLEGAEEDNPLVVLVHTAVEVQTQVEDRHIQAGVQEVLLADRRVQEVEAGCSFVVVVVDLVVGASSHVHSSFLMVLSEPLVSGVGKAVMEVVGLLVAHCVLVLVLQACALLRHHVVHPCHPFCMRIALRFPYLIDIAHACLRSQSRML